MRPSLFEGLTHGLGASSHLTARFVGATFATYSWGLHLNPALAVMNVMLWFFRFSLWLEFG